jgi:hypothetical protein
MAHLIAVVGESGTGKSTSIENLDPKETFIINVLKKPLPFKGSGKKYNVENKNMIALHGAQEIVSTIKGVAENRPEVKQIILDDIGHVMVKEAFVKAGHSGYGKFTEMGRNMFNIIEAAKNVRDDLNIVFMWHQTTELVDGFKPQVKIKTLGKVLDNWLNPEEVFTVVLYTQVDTSEKGATYNFITNRDGTYPAKSPKGMFESIKIPNDLKEVFQAISEYY